MNFSISTTLLINFRFVDRRAVSGSMPTYRARLTTENKISFARQSFNDMVTSYNSYRQTFPAIFFAGIFGHAQNAKLLEFEDAQEIKKAPKVSF